MSTMAKPLSEWSDDEIRAFIADGRAKIRAIRAELIQVAAERDRRTNDAEARRLLDRLGPDVIRRAAELAQKVDTEQVKPGAPAPNT